MQAAINFLPVNILRHINALTLFFFLQEKTLSHLLFIDRLFTQEIISIEFELYIYILLERLDIGLRHIQTDLFKGIESTSVSVHGAVSPF